MTTLIIFGLLLTLMLTGMPISISLGLTVLTFLFTMTEVPIESVALKLFTGIEKFEIMAIPFFILAGNFLMHGGVAKRMIRFATTLVGHWYGGLGLAGVVSCALFAAITGSSVATVVAVGSIILPAMVKQGYPQRFGAGVITTSGAGHPVSAVHQPGDVLHCHRRHGCDRPGWHERVHRIGRPAVHGGCAARPVPVGIAGPDHLVPCQEV
jgi:TRAP-type mannitol/chloroaromatic compound transport system permease large subunit